jgi:hypothetical protein
VRKNGNYKAMIDICIYAFMHLIIYISTQNKRNVNQFTGSNFRAYSYLVFFHEKGGKICYWMLSYTYNLQHSSIKQ